MPLYDVVCEGGHESLDVFKKINDPYPPCETCGLATERLWRASSGVIADDIPGGVVIEHGLCWDDGTPRKFYSKSEMARVAREKGLVNYVRHAPSPGSDKSKHTTRWY